MDGFHFTVYTMCTTILVLVVGIGAMIYLANHGHLGVGPKMNMFKGSAVYNNY